MTNEEQTILIAYLVEAQFMAWHQVREGVVQGFGDLAQFCTGGNTGWGSCAFPGFLAWFPRRPGLQPFWLGPLYYWLG